MRIEPDEVVALAGPNGSGKTTLAKLLAGLYLPCTGRVCWDGRDTRQVNRRELLAHTAIVFQDFIQYALSAGDNMALGRHSKRLTRRGLSGLQSGQARIRTSARCRRDIRRCWGRRSSTGPTCRRAVAAGGAGADVLPGRAAGDPG
jgi:ABC-type sugar transport system ATPase subunit